MTIDLYCGDCLEIMPTLSGPFDAIIADLPYGTTACKWDTVIPFEPLWEQYKRLIKPKGAIVLFGSQPFTSALVMSNVEWFKYEWVWQKTRPGDFVSCNHRPMKNHENIVVFSDGGASPGCSEPMPYTPQGVRFKEETRIRNTSLGIGRDRDSQQGEYLSRGSNYPRTVILFSNDETGLHPTQKPVPLLEYLIRTYTNEGETVLDNTMGSGTTGVACMNTGRNFAGIELLQEYFEIAETRIEKAQVEMIQTSFV